MRVIAATAALTLLAILAATTTFIAVQGTLRSLESETRAQLDIQTALVENIQVRRSIPTLISEVPRQSVELPSPTLLAGESSVVTSSATDGHLSNGDLLLTVADRPVIALVGAVPAFRQLHFGIFGSDVAQVQQALGTLGYQITDRSGYLGYSTADALAELYSSHMSQLVNSNGVPIDPKTAIETMVVPRGELSFFESFPVSLSKGCPRVGEILEAGLCSVTSIEVSTLAEVSAGEADLVSEGQRVELQMIDGSIRQATLGRQLSGSQLSGSAEASVGASLQSQIFQLNSPVQIDVKQVAMGEIIVAESDEGSLAIPAVAVNTDGHGEYWIIPANNPKSRIKVGIGLCSSGFCEVKSSSKVYEGLELIILQSGA